jgi:outer membrane lipoprotein-sorting protein
MLLGTSFSVNAQKYEISGNKSLVSQDTEITLSGSSKGKFYYLFKIDENGDYQFITFMVGQGIPLNYAPQKSAGKYVIYEFDEFKEMPFNFEKFKPTDGILQAGEITITSSTDNKNP